MNGNTNTKGIDITSLIAPSEEDESCRSVQDLLFRHVFSDNLLPFYTALHPEDKDTTEADLALFPDEADILQDLHSDLSFYVRNGPVTAAEVMSAWSDNVSMRCSFSLAKAYAIYLDRTHQDPFGSERVELPEPELYAIYTGKEDIKKKEISMAEDLFEGDPPSMEARVKVISGTDGDDIIHQYIACCWIIDEQVRLRGRTEAAVEEAFHICRDRNILRGVL